MNTRCLLLSLIFFSSNIVAQSPWIKSWDKRFGGTTTDVLTSASATSDGGLLLVGHSWSPAGADKNDPNCILGSSAADYWIVKTDSLGGKMWDRTYGGNSSDQVTKILELPSHNILVAGYSISDSSCEKTFHSWGSNSYDYWILLVDSIGNKIWDHAYGGTNDDKLQVIQHTMDNGYILGGWSISDSSGDKSQNSWHQPQNNNPTADYWIIKTDSSGNKLWDKTYGGTALDRLTCIDITSDGGFILGGFSRSGISGDKTEASFDTSSNSNYNADYWIVKTDSMGNKLWDRTYGGLNQDKLFSIHQLSDGDYVLGGYSGSGAGGNKSDPGKGGFDYWIIRTDSVGDILWDRSLGGIGDENQWEYWASIETGLLIEDKDGGFIMSGASESGISGDKTENNLGSRQIWVVKTDAVGNKLWDKTILTDTIEDNGILIPFGDSCFVIAATTYAGIGGDKTEPTRGFCDYWSIVYCQPMVNTGMNIPEVIFQPQIFPNPSSQSLYISIPESFSENITVSIYDVPGRTVRFWQFTNSTELIIPDFATLSNGMYLVEVVSGTYRSMERIIKN